MQMRTWRLCKFFVSICVIHCHAQHGFPKHVVLDRLMQIDKCILYL